MSSQLPRLAVVEDCDSMRTLLVKHLADSGFHVDGYADAASLWRDFSHHLFDLVILDVGLPGEDGFAVSRRLRRHTDIPVVMLTGYGSTEHQLLGLREGADAYLVKPVDINILVATLNRLTRCASVSEGIGPGHAAAWWLSADGWLLRTPDDREVLLNGHERDLLRCLVGLRLSRVPSETLIRALERSTHPFDRDRLDRVIRRLQNKVTAFSSFPLPLASRLGGLEYTLKSRISGDPHFNV